MDVVQGSNQCGCIWRDPERFHGDLKY